ncbi:hypothetical protein [Nocardiopsis ansamitocini]|uniref:Uncharacterized protein n=1 Tax=Nocardiopsis ansamitocini TaxID=1670832 RepID=A0A9W6P8F9_9ACTN|nr:hypothetical protein [Nocardiopsis ansamitocini]GLU49080.1 hypothetical protein Nans01_34310 [Nocardiopsis ansamitocini]
MNLSRYVRDHYLDDTPATTALRLLPRALGVFTMGYALYVIASPEAMTVPTALSGQVADPEVATLTRAVLARDLACGAAMLLVPSGAALYTAIGIRVASDLGDAIGFGLTLPTQDARTSSVLVAGVFGAVCALSALGAYGPRRRRDRAGVRASKK